MVEDGPHAAGQATEELDRRSGGDQAGERVLSADVLRPARLLLAHAEEHDEPGDGSAAEEREVDLLQVVDRDWNAGGPVSVEPPSLRAAWLASAVEDEQLLSGGGYTCCSVMRFLGHSADEADVRSPVVAKIAASPAPDALWVLRMRVVGGRSGWAGRVADVREDEPGVVGAVAGQARRGRVHTRLARGLTLAAGTSHVCIAYWTLCNAFAGIKVLSVFVGIEKQDW